jgi:hypothetical protein
MTASGVGVAVGSAGVGGAEVGEGTTDSGWVTSVESWTAGTPASAPLLIGATSKFTPTGVGVKVGIGVRVGAKALCPPDPARILDKLQPNETKAKIMGSAKIII